MKWHFIGKRPKVNLYFLSIFQPLTQMAEFVSMFHIWPATELMTVILAAHLETLLIVKIFCAVEHEASMPSMFVASFIPYLNHCSPGQIL